MSFKRESVIGLLGDFFTYGIGNIIVSGITIIMTPILTRIFAPYDYGIIDVAQVSVGIIVIMATLQMDSAILRYYNESEDKKGLLFTHLLSTIGVSLCVILFGLVFLKQINAALFKGDSATAAMLPYAILTVPTTLLIRHILILFRTLRKPRHVIIVSSVVAASYLLLTVIFVVSFGLGIKGVFLAKAVSEAAVFIIMVFLFRSFYSLNFSFALLSKILRFSLPMMPERVAYICLTKANRYFLLAYATMTDIAKFNIAQKVPALLMLAITGFEQAWFPYAFSLMHNEHAKEIFRHIFDSYMKFMFYLTFIIILFAREIILLLSTKEYLDTVNLIGIVGADIVMFGAAQIVAIGLLIKEKPQLYSLATIISAVITLILSYVFIPKFGILGAAVSLFIANFIITVVVYLYAQKYYPVKYDLRLLIGYFILIPVLNYAAVNLLGNASLSFRFLIAVLSFLALIPFIKKEIGFVKSIFKEKFSIRQMKLSPERL